MESDPKLAEAERLMNDDQFQRAVEIVDGVLAERPDDTAALLLRVRAHLHYGANPEAHSVLQRVHVLGDRSKKFFNCRMHLALKEEQLEEAIDIADEAFDASRGELVLYPMIYILHSLEAGWSTESMKAGQELEQRVLARWLQKSPDSVQARQELAKLNIELASNKPAREKEAANREAMELARALVAEDPSDPGRQTELARIALRTGSDEATAAVRRALELGVSPDRLGFEVVSQLHHPATARFRPLTLPKLSQPLRIVLGLVVFLPALHLLNSGLVELGMFFLAAALLFEMLPPLLSVADTFLWRRDPVLARHFGPRELAWAQAATVLIVATSIPMLCLPLVAPKVRVSLLLGLLTPFIFVWIGHESREIISPRMAWAMAVTGVLGGAVVFFILSFR